MDTHKNPNLETTTTHHHEPPSSSHNHKRTQIKNTIIKNLDDKKPSFSSIGDQNQEQDQDYHQEQENDVVSRKSFTTATLPPPPPPVTVAVVEEESGRERLKRHRVEMAGRVWIPDIWEQEDLLKEWIDCSMFDSSLGNKSIMSARTALVQEARSTATVASN